jgi:hypothetical protein
MLAGRGEALGAAHGAPSRRQHALRDIGFVGAHPDLVETVGHGC